MTRQGRGCEQHGEDDPVVGPNIGVTKHEADAACGQKQNDDHAQRFRAYTMRKAVEQGLASEKKRQQQAQ